MSQSPSDFTTGPVAPVAFAGRRPEAALILRRARRPVPPLQSLEGPSKIGRTSMLRFLQAVSRSEVRLEGFDPREGAPVVAPYVDLTFHGRQAQAAQEVILRAILDEMRAHGLDAPQPGDGLDGISQVALAMERACGEGHRFLLLVDHVEQLLTTRSPQDGEREHWSHSATSVLGELNERTRIAVLLAFGATGPAKDLRASARRLRMLETLDALSQILNRGDATRTTLELLEDSEVRAFATTARIPGRSGAARRPNSDEVNWIVELAGGHPLVMQNAGLRLAEVKGPREFAAARVELERQLADPGLQGLVIDVFRRIGPPDGGQVAALEQLASGSEVELSSDLAAPLAEEGLIEPVEARSIPVTMRSRALRWALGAYLAAREAAEPAATPSGETHPRIPSPVLGLAGHEPGPALHLTRSEHALVRVMLGVEEGEVVSRAELGAALGRNTGDPQLTQRISVLRGKIESILGVSDAIENVYGQGYRLLGVARYELRDLA